MPPLRILYVEDNPELRETVAELLADDRHEVVVCADGESAFDTWRERDFDLLVTDISLPGMSGTELTRRVLAVKPEQWVVWCSGYEYRDMVASFGVNVRALPKAFDLEALDALFDEVSRALAAKAP